MEASFIVQSNHGIMAEQEEDLGSSSLDEETEESSNSISSSSSDFLEDATSSLSNGSQEEEEGPLFEMSDLFSQLPFKRGLSKHFQGKSQSFSSLTNVRRLEDLAKPERAYKKKLISSKSYGGGLDCNKALSCAKAITKKSSKVSFSSLGPRRKGFFGSGRASFVSLRSSGDLSGQALLFA